MNDERMIEPEEAWQRIAAQVRSLPPVEISLVDLAGHVLAEEVVAEEDVPPFPAATVDGWAVVAADSSPRRLILEGKGTAGVMPTVQVTVGTAARVMTGAPLPPGADGVVMVEDSTEEEGWIRFSRSIRPGDGVRPAGSDLAAGQVVLSPGTVMGPAEVGLMATVGRVAARVYPRPRVAVFSTGDELVEPGDRPEPGQICDSNRYALLAAIRQAGGEPISLGIAPDDEEGQRALLLRALEQADALVTSGGVSIGTRDLIGPLLAQLGTVHFHRVRQKPGKPFTFATVGGKPCFGLPGNPVSSLVTFELYVRPALRLMAGHRLLWRPKVEAKLRHPVKHDPVRIEFQRAIVEQEEGEWRARTTGSQASSRLLSMVGANALLRLSAGPLLPAGATVTAILTGQPECTFSDSSPQNS
ncbi:MAG TPA: molybdopterin molybdenumtransferase MoeA [Chloroflexi bacterium]|nr:molybdopterin molybdenumtransferase MoeA [Chloroflexota bacterium]